MISPDRTVWKCAESRGQAEPLGIFIGEGVVMNLRFRLHPLGFSSSDPTLSLPLKVLTLREKKLLHCATFLHQISKQISPGSRNSISSFTVLSFYGSANTTKP